ncbi:MAG: MFS transporter [Nitrososphaeria archaeon]
MSRNLVRLSAIMFYIYYMWILMVKYDSVFLVSLIPTLSLAGYLLVLLPEGYILDRFPREMVMFVSSLAIMAVYLSLFISQALLWVYAAAMMSSVFSSISSDAFFTLMKDIVNPSSMGRGMSLVEAGRGVSEIAGIALGGASIILLSDKFIPLIVLVSATSVAFGIPRIERGRKTAQKKYGFSHIFKAIKIILPFLLIGLLINGLFVSIEVYASGLFYKVLNVGPSYYTMFVLCFSAGGLAGGLLGVRISKRLENPAFIASAMAFFGLSFLVLSVSRVPYGDVLVMVPLGMVNSLTNIPLMSYLVKIIPNEVLGRVNSVTTMFLASASPVMAVVYGLLSRVFPIPTILLLIAGLLAISSVPTYITIKKLFKLTESSIKAAMDS